MKEGNLFLIVFVNDLLKKERLFSFEHFLDDLNLCSTLSHFYDNHQATQINMYLLKSNLSGRFI